MKPALLRVSDTSNLFPVIVISLSNGDELLPPPPPQKNNKVSLNKLLTLEETHIYMFLISSPKI